MSYPIIEINQLSVRFTNDYQQTIAVKNINFSVNKNEIVAVVGESGSGKTVTSLSILKLLQGSAPDISGNIFYSSDGKERKDIVKMNENEIRSIRGNGISMIFQEPMTSLNPLMTCGAQVIEAIRIHNKINYTVAKNKTIALFEKVKLPDAANIINKFPHQLSGGQKQRVMIAMAMCCSPTLLIADEPTTALDVTVQKTILELIKQLQNETGMGVIYITHDLNLVAQIANRIIVMLKGEIVEQGDAKTIFTNPMHPYTKALIACRPDENSKGNRLPTISDFINNLQPAVKEKNIEFQNSKNKISTPLIEVKNLSISFPLKKNILGKTISSFLALDNLSFTINKKETLGIVGESGCGKTTLGRCLVRLLKPTDGHIIFNGTNLANIDEQKLREMRKDIQIIFQDPFGSLNPRLTIGAAIAEPLKVHKRLHSKEERRLKVIELLHKVDLKPEHFNRYPHQFSGGQRQRICIARALSLNPDFIVCDESVSALDISVQAQVLNLLNDLKQELEFTCVFISHDLGVVRYISDRILVMNKGKLVELGEADDIYFNPRQPYTQKLISATPQRFTPN